MSLGGHQGFDCRHHTSVVVVDDDDVVDGRPIFFIALFLSLGEL